MTQKTVVITGGTGGIGLHSAIAIAKVNGTRVIVTGRSRERGEAAVAHITSEAGASPGQVVLVVGDVSSLGGIDALARDILGQTDRIDVLVNNAGYLGNEKRASDDGLEMHFAINVLSPWRLTHALLPALQACGAARVVNLSAGDNPPGTPIPLDINNLQAEKGFKGLLTMAHSKSVMESLSMAMARELEPKGVTVNVVFPGRASTAMTRSLSMKGLPGPMKIMMPCMRIFFADDGGKGAAKAARSTVWASTSAELDGVTGRYYDASTKERKMPKKALNPEVQARIIAVIEATSATPNRNRA
jgi:NAD(P)-dependent dehydrogenase (short-subunit alcohol dehydrogenase family)